MSDCGSLDYDPEEDENNPDNYMHDLDFDPFEASEKAAAVMILNEGDGSSESDAENQLPVDLPYLKIPFHFGFMRSVTDVQEKLEKDGPCQRVTYKHACTGTTLTCIEQVHAFLLERDMALPISTFTFEPDVNIHAKYFRKWWNKIIFKDDLSDGKERRKIQVICQGVPPEKLAEYVLDNYVEENANVRIDHDDQFFVCCECPNDCKDKLNCPCFQKTLDNCSKQTREFVGDENIGYHFQRLYSSLLSGIYECNKLCKCRKSTCFNTVVQNGINVELQLFKTDLKGWGVRTLGYIPRGGFISTYSGKIVSGQFADKLSMNIYSGKWKYLSELLVSNEPKEGYESEVVEPELLSTEETRHVELNNECDDEEEWEDFEDFEDNTDNSFQLSQPEIDPEEWEDFMRDDVEQEEQANDSDPKSTTIRKRRGSARVVYQRSNRSLRSTDASFQQERPENYEMLPTGRVGLVRRSLKDVLLLSRLNKKAEKLSKNCQHPLKRSTLERKPTFYMFLDDYNKMEEESQYYDNLNEMKVQRNKDQIKMEKLLQPTHLSDQYVKESVLAAFKGGDNTGANNAPLPSSSKRKFIVGNKKVKRVRRRKRLGLTYKKTVKTAQEKKVTHPLLDLNFNVDGREKGNIGRYFNHSCDPNMIPQYVFTSSHDLRFPRIAFFAKRNIRAGEELTWDYKYEQVKPVEDKGKHDDQPEQQIENQVQEQLLLQQANIGNDDKGNNDNIKRGTRRGCGTRRGSLKQPATLTVFQCRCGADNCTSK